MRGWMLLVLLGTACGTTEAPAPEADPVEEPEAAPAVDARVVKAAAVAKAIKAGTDPVEAMKAQDLDEDGFRKLLYDIAEDPELSKAYEAERNH